MSATVEFSSPNVEALDYYERLGAPPDADADDIANHTKKYVAKFKPELSDHDNADERWNRFNDARQTLNEPDTKEEYDTFRERFGTQDGAEAYEAWEARDRPRDPATLDPARDLNRPSIGDDTADASGDETTSDQTTRDRTDDSQQSRSRSRSQETAESDRERRRRERQRRRRAADIDLDSSKAHSTRNVDRETESETEGDAGGEPAAATSTARQVLAHLRQSGRVATREVVTVLGMLELVVASYLVYVVTVEVGAASVADAVGATLIQDAVTVGVVLGLGFVLVSRYLQRFGDDPANPGGRPSPGRQLVVASDEPTWFVYGPAVAAVLFGGLLLLGGGGTTLLFLGLAVLFTYGRYRLVAELVPTPDWSQYVDVAGGVGAATLFVAVFALSTPGVGVEAGLSGAGPAVAVVLVVLVTAIVAVPSAALGLDSGDS